eukprot:1157305-Pelagomonas_calceolata.AAC.1
MVLASSYTSSRDLVFIVYQPSWPRLHRTPAPMPRSTCSLLCLACRVLLVSGHAGRHACAPALAMQEAIANVIAGTKQQQAEQEDVGSLADAVKQQKVRKKRH